MSNDQKQIIYRELGREEIILHGDEYLPFGCTDAWFQAEHGINSTVAAQLARPNNQAEKYRRAVTDSPAPACPFPAVRNDYRELVLDEVIEEGDEFFGVMPDAAWLLVQESIGKTLRECLKDQNPHIKKVRRALVRDKKTDYDRYADHYMEAFRNIRMPLEPKPTERYLKEYAALVRSRLSGSALLAAEMIGIHYLSHARVSQTLLELIDLTRGASKPSPAVEGLIAEFVMKIKAAHFHDFGLELEWPVEPKSRD